MLESALGRMLSTCRYWRPESLSVTEDYGCYLAEGKSMRKIHRLALCASLVVGIVTATPAIASATPSSGVTAVTIEDHVIGGTDYVLKKITIAPGGTTGWHVHPGPVLVIVKTGSVTKYSAEDCTAQTYTAGQAFVENGLTGENMVRNDGSVLAETIMTFITPPGAPIRDDAPPPGCNP